MNLGHICLADLNEERRRPVLVASRDRFNRLSGRVLVVPAIDTEPEEELDPWRVAVGDTVFAVDHLRSIPVARLLDKVDTAPVGAVVAVQRAIRLIT